MLTLSHKVLIAICLAAIVGFFAGNATAEPIIYDFDTNVGDTLSAGAIIGQDNWEDHHTGADAVNVASGASGWSGNYAYHNVTSDSLQTIVDRPNDGNWAVSLQDGYDFEISAKFLTVHSSQVTTIGLDYNIGHGHDNWMVFGVYQSNFLWQVRENDPAGDFTDLIKITNESIPADLGNIYMVGYEVKAQGGNEYDFLPFYEDLTTPGSRVYGNGGTPINVTFSSNLSGMFNQIYLRMGSYAQGAIVDDFVIDQVPEPSTMGLLACGLVGLLAYAWRKRN